MQASLPAQSTDLDLHEFSTMQEYASITVMRLLGPTLNVKPIAYASLATSRRIRNFGNTTTCDVRRSQGAAFVGVTARRSSVELMLRRSYRAAFIS